MKKKIYVSIAGLIIAIAVIWAVLSAARHNEEAKYQFAEVTRGDLEGTISCSGTLSPVTTVEVGTQVSGIIAHLYADFNDYVKKGQLMAVLDTVLLKASVMDAQAGMEKAEAQLQQAQADYDRNKTLFQRELISDADFLPYRINLRTQEANLKSAQATLIRAERNLKYADIYAPISGTVTARNVEEGQTVAASLSAPTLFVIAEDLHKMEILADVDESDIGQIKDGQSVRFDVQAYPDKTFTGTVKQIRLQPQTVSNVVTYTVVVSADNKDNLLLPGMTATVDFIIQQKQDVLMVPNTALRFQPDEKTLAEFEKSQKDKPDSLKSNARPRRGGMNGNRGRAEGRQSNFGHIWYLNPKGKIEIAVVMTGMTDGFNTEIVRTTDLKEGMKVITGMGTSSDQSTTNNQRFTPGRMRGF